MAKKTSTGRDVHKLMAQKWSTVWKWPERTVRWELLTELESWFPSFWFRLWPTPRDAKNQTLKTFSRFPLFWYFAAKFVTKKKRGTQEAIWAAIWTHCWPPNMRMSAQRKGMDNVRHRMERVVMWRKREEWIRPYWGHWVACVRYEAAEHAFECCVCSTDVLLLWLKMIFCAMKCCLIWFHLHQQNLSSSERETIKRRQSEDLGNNKKVIPADVLCEKWHKRWTNDEQIITITHNIHFLGALLLCFCWWGGCIDAGALPLHMMLQLCCDHR